jgi:hypothetical protein
MSTTPESVPTTWSVADEHFFRAVAHLFATSFLWGASALLESYDESPALTPAPAALTDNPARTEPAAAWPLAA